MAIDPRTVDPRVLPDFAQLYLNTPPWVRNMRPGLAPIQMASAGATPAPAAPATAQAPLMTVAPPPVSLTPGAAAPLSPTVTPAPAAPAAPAPPYGGPDEGMRARASGGPGAPGAPASVDPRLGPAPIPPVRPPGFGVNIPDNMFGPNQTPYGMSAFMAARDAMQGGGRDR